MGPFLFNSIYDKLEFLNSEYWQLKQVGAFER